MKKDTSQLIACQALLLGGVAASGIAGQPLGRRDGRRSWLKQREVDTKGEEGDTGPASTTAAENVAPSKTLSKVGEPTGASAEVSSVDGGEEQTPTPSAPSATSTTSTTSNTESSTTSGHTPVGTTEASDHTTTATTSAVDHTTSSTQTTSIAESAATTTTVPPVTTTEPPATTATPSVTTSVTTQPPVTTQSSVTSQSSSTSTLSTVAPSTQPTVSSNPSVDPTPNVPTEAVPTTTSSPADPPPTVEPNPQPSAGSDNPQIEPSPTVDFFSRPTPIRQFHQASTDSLNWPAIQINAGNAAGDTSQDSPVSPDWSLGTGSTSSGTGANGGSGSGSGGVPNVVGGDTSTSGLGSTGASKTTTIVASLVVCAFVAALVVGGLLYRRHRRSASEGANAADDEDDDPFYSSSHTQRKGTDGSPPPLVGLTVDPFSLTPPRSVASRSNSTRSNKSAKSAKLRQVMDPLAAATQSTKQKLIGALEVVKGTGDGSIGSSSSASKDRERVPSILLAQPPPLGYYDTTTPQRSAATDKEQHDKLEKDMNVRDVILPGQAPVNGTGGVFSMISDASSGKHGPVGGMGGGMLRRGSLPHYPSYMSFVTIEEENEDVSFRGSVLEGVTTHGAVVPVQQMAHGRESMDGGKSLGESQRSSRTFGHGLGGSPKGGWLGRNRHSRSLSDTSFVTQSSDSSYETMTRSSWRAPEDWDIKFNPVVLRNIGEVDGVPYRGSMDVLKAVDAIRAAQGVGGRAGLSQPPADTVIPRELRPTSMQSSICDSLDRVMASYGAGAGNENDRRNAVDSWMSRGTVETDRTSASLSRYL
ncbi:hypothetical protein HDV00_006734 [Rhizophlyctis rosea]|nr:hypothetical protein HDV00_006734 [Rhizophlyctis rosea]